MLVTGEPETGRVLCPDLFFCLQFVFLFFKCNKQIKNRDNFLSALNPWDFFVNYL